MKIYKDNFNNLSFCDFDCIEMYLDKILNIINIKTQGAYYKVLNRSEILSNVSIKIFDW
jgi:hypothetical protein